jgi:hypothetical protein
MEKILDRAYVISHRGRVYEGPLFFDGSVFQIRSPWGCMRFEGDYGRHMDKETKEAVKAALQRTSEQPEGF